MVWKGDASGRRLAKSLITLVDQVDAMWPGRDKSSDGSIGDAAHQARASDHNPNAAGVVTALDLDRDVAAGFDARALAEALVASRDPRIKYIISNGEIISSKVSPWVWRPYTGANAHREHMHISVDGDPRLYDDARPWAISAAQRKPAGQHDMRFTNITATVFGGPDDAMSGTQTAYGNLIAPGWWDRPGCALPTRMTERPLPIVRVRNRANGLTVDCPVIDVGPWNKKDPYWFTGTRPRAELGQFDDYGRKPTNKAGIDLTPAAAKAIGLNGKGLVDWDFVDHLEATNGEVLDPPPKSPPSSDAAEPLLPLLLLMILTKEKPMTEQPTAGQGQPDLARVLLTAVLQSALSGKPIDANDLLLTIMRGMLGVPALAAPAATDTAKPSEAAAPQNANDALLQVLLKALAAQQMPPPVKKPDVVEPPPPATVPGPGPATAPVDRGAASAGFLGLALSALGQLFGFMPVTGEAATMVGPTVATVSGLAAAGGALGAISPTLGIIARIAGAVLGAVRR